MLLALQLNNLLEAEESADRTVNATTVALALTAQTAVVTREGGVAAQVEELEITGHAATITRTRAVTAQAVAMTLAAHSASVTRGTQIVFLTQDRIHVVNRPRADRVRVA